MANLSQIKREEMIAFLETLKQMNIEDEQIKKVNALISGLRKYFLEKVNNNK